MVLRLPTSSGAGLRRHVTDPSGLTAAFAAAMCKLGPFEPAPLLAVGVSGGADSMALALLAQDWAAMRGGRATAFVVDHGLRAESADEAALALARLSAQGIRGRVLPLSGLRHGAALAARARAARHAALRAACAEAGILHLLLGHHLADQAETVAMRLLARSGPAGLAGMGALVESPAVRLVRPLLGVAPGLLRNWLRRHGIAWVEDPSNADPAALRARLRALRGDADGTGPVTRAMGFAAGRRGERRAAAEADSAAVLAARAAIHPEGFALLTPGAIDAAALAALLAMVSGSGRMPSVARVADLAGRLRPATLGGVQVLPAGKLGAGWLLVREAAAIGPAVAAQDGAVWDGRFRLENAAALPAGCLVGALGRSAGALRRRSRLPAAVLHALPALWLHGTLVAVPHLRYRDATVSDLDPASGAVLRFCPAVQAAGAVFVASC
jgi:tRNA(Ile)-lysidine synthase